jgi:long-chain acyl-CoA synthetase
MDTSTISDLATLAEDALQQQGEHTALIFNGVEFSNAKILANSRRLQSAFLDLGLGKGDITLVCMVNDSLVHSIFLGGFRTGVTLAPVVSQLIASELEFIIQHTESKAVITDVDKIDVMRDAVKHAPQVEWIAVRGGVSDETRMPREIRLEDLLEYPESPTFANLTREDTGLILYTSGTTGKPKGVMLTQGNLLASGETLVEAAEFHLREHPLRSITALPMAHIFGISLMTVEYLVPAKYPPGYFVQEAQFDAERILKLIEEHQCTDFSAVPTMMSLMLNHPRFDYYDLSSLFKTDVGGAPLPVELARQWKAKLGSHLRQRYGMTENSGKGSTDRTSEPYYERSVGRPYHTTDLIITDDDDNVLPAGQTGEILTAGPMTMKGYFKDPAATAITLRNGWLHTGDIGYLNKDGWLYVVDRKKDMIIKGGENIYPAELEDVFYKNPAISEAAVVGIPHDIFGEEPIAIVVLLPNHIQSESEILEHMKNFTTKFKIPSRVIFKKELPKSGVGKILRRSLRDELVQVQITEAHNTKESS